MVSIARDGEKKRPVGLSEFKGREMLWLWCRLAAKGYGLNPDLVGEEVSRANHLIKSIYDSDVETVRELREYRDECFSRQLDASEFKWIKPHDERLKHWIVETITQYGQQIGMRFPPFDPSVLAYREHVMLLFDLGDAPVQTKKWFMSELRRRWSSNIEIDQELKWINKSDEEQCRWLVDEVLQSDIGVSVANALRFPVSNEDRFLLLANALDRSGLGLQFKKLFLKDLKSKWDKKNKKSVAKKVQCNLNVDPDIHRYIKESAKSRGIRMGEYVENLVTEEMKRQQGQGA